MLKLGRKLFSPSYISQKIFENLIGIPERQELFAGLPLVLQLAIQAGLDLEYIAMVNLGGKPT